MKKEKIEKYIKNHILTIYFILSSLINSTVLRWTILDNSFSLKPFLIDLGLILLVCSFSYFIKPKSRIKYYGIWSFIFVAICIINAHYYGYYSSFASISLLATSTFVTDVSDAVVKDVLHIKYFLYLWQLFGLLYLNYRLKKNKYYEKRAEYNKKKIFKKTLITSLIVICSALIFVKGSEWNRFRNLWNRETVVRTFGIYTYQFNDLIQSLRPRLNNIFGHDKAYKSFVEYYEDKKDEKTTNKYTGIFEGKNVIVIHAESIQGIALNREFNGKEVTPNLNKLSKEGIYFSNFYSQVGVGTSSDAEFTFSTSLMPSSSGTVFVNYFNRDYVTIQKLMKEKGYYVTSMHANNGDFWNREVMHKNMGYDMFYDKDYFTIDETIGLGLSDKSFFKQVIPYLQDIKLSNKKFYTTLIMLSNHTPFDDLELTDEFETLVNYDINGRKITANPIEGTMLENYFRSVHYADQAIGQLINDLDENGLLDNTVLIIYGDHEARIDKEEYDLLYNYNPLTSKLYDESDENYVEYNKYDYELDKKVPFIIWTKDKIPQEEVTIPTGMIDALPTLGNMFNIKSKYQLGTDIFNIITGDNTVTFTDGSYLTSKIYYSAQKNEIYPITGEAVEESYVKKNAEKSDKIIEISNDIINFNLIKEYEEKQLVK